MSLDIGRKGWVGVGIQSGFDSPGAISDYLPFQANSLTGVQEQIPVNHATGNRDTTHTSVPGKAYSQGNFDMVADPNLCGYLLAAAQGTVQTTSLGSGAYSHLLTRTNSNTPLYLSLTSDRVKDRQLYPNVAVDELELEVGTELAMLKTKLKGSFPSTTTSGTNTTASGNVFSFRNGSAAFGSTVDEATNGANIKPHNFKLQIKNNVEVIHRHGSNNAASVNSRSYDVNM